MRDDDMDDDNICPTCRGTGIGQHGDPMTSRCYRCHGTGTIREDDDWPERVAEKDENRV